MSILPVRLLVVVNKNLPDNDYRLTYRRYTRYCQVMYALPEKPASLAPDEYLYAGFDEGLKLADLRHYLNFFAYLLKHRRQIDLVSYYSTGLILFGPLMARLAGLECMFTLTGFGRTFSSPGPIYALLQPVYRLLLYLAIRMSRTVLLQNRASAETLKSWFPSLADRLIYVGSAVEGEAVRQKSFDSQRLRVVHIGRLLEDKGMRDFLAVAERLAGERFEFILIGKPSPGFESLFADIQTAHQRGQIRYAGEVSTAEVAAELATAEIFFFPSYYGEGMARVMLEAGFAHACPIAYDIPANLDLLAEGRGFMVSFSLDNFHERVARVCELLEQLYQNRLLLEMNARCYQEFILENYGIEQFSERLDQIVRPLVTPASVRPYSAQKND